jgi:hypothetical protein
VAELEGVHLMRPKVELDIGMADVLARRDLEARSFAFMAAIIEQIEAGTESAASMSNRHPHVGGARHTIPAPMPKPRTQVREPWF